jgi:diguanylate cyclase (GGDEF)-like protein/PAS domain S-box-containing protein
MKQKVNLALQNLFIGIFFGLFIYIKWIYFSAQSYYLDLFINLIFITFIYLVAQPVWLKTFIHVRRAVIYLVTGLTLIVSVVWNMEQLHLNKDSIGIELYFLPIILATLFFSMKVGLFLSLAVTLSSMMVELVLIGFDPKVGVDGLIIFIILSLTVVLVSRMVKARDEVANKQSILLEHSHALVLGMTQDGKIDLCNHGMSKFLGMNTGDILGEYAWALEQQLDNKDQRAIFQILYSKKQYVQEEIKVRKDNQTYIFLIDTHILKDDGLMSGKTMLLTDITDQKEMQQKLHELAITDQLTGLYNRRYFEEKFKQEIIRSNRYGHIISVLFLDVDHFKRVNDQYGHAEGDKVLQMLSRTIAEQTRETDLCARFGGEEFAILLPETDEVEAVKVAERIRQGVEASPIMTTDQKHTITVTVSIGGVVREQDFHLVQMLEEADKQLYRAKETGRNRVFFQCEGEASES